LGKKSNYFENYFRYFKAKSLLAPLKIIVCLLAKKELLNGVWLGSLREPNQTYTQSAQLV
jgi:hypothetical protein